MNHKEFFMWLEGYYGKYPRSILRREVGEYVRSIPGNELDRLSEHLRQTFSTQYNFTPDVATLEIARQDIIPAPTQHVYKLPPPEPGAMDMKVEVGQLMEIVLMKVNINKEKREKVK